MTTFAPSAKPRWAVTAWVDANNIFIEIPIRDAAPFIWKSPLTTAGLAEARGRMRDYHTQLSGPPVYIPPHRPATKLPPPTYPLATQLAAQEILRKLGITGK